MSYAVGKRTASSGPQTSMHGAAPLVGKTSLVEGAYAVIQAKRSAGPQLGDLAPDLASPSGPGRPLPPDVRARMERAFNANFEPVRIYEGPEALAMGARAFTRGWNIYFAPGEYDPYSARGLELLGHELAHVVQQSEGRVYATTQAKGMDVNADAGLEQEADTLGAQAARGEVASRGGGAVATLAATGPAQMKLAVNGTDETDVEAVWNRIKGDPRFEGIQDAAKALLRQWIEAAAKYSVAEVDKVSSNREYPSDEALIRGLSGDVRAAGNLAREGELARQTLEEGHVNGVLGSIVAKLKLFQEANQQALPSSAKAGRYGGWAYPKAKMQDAVQADPGDLRGRIAMIADYALAVKGDVPKKQWNFMMTGEQNASRSTHWNTNEEATWVEEARANDMPLSAGPSATTAQVLALASLLGCSVDEKAALAWALFTLWNDMPLNLAGTHRFHEVMDVAALHGVPYERFQYSEPPGAQGGGQ